MAEYELLVCAKTYPELSESHRETVCTAGCTLTGSPKRLYPVSLRYLPEVQRYRLWDVVRFAGEPNRSDPRPESVRLGQANEFRVMRHVRTPRGSWEERRRVVYADSTWHFGCVKELQARQREHGTSLGFVPVAEVEDVRLQDRPEKDRLAHDRKLNRLKSQQRLFGLAQKDLQFFGERVLVRWRCPSDECTGHNHQILDWGLGELGRREDSRQMLRRMEQLCDLSEFDLAFFLGNLRLRPQTFTVIGLWYPKHKNQRQASLL